MAFFVILSIIVLVLVIIYGIRLVEAVIDYLNRH